MNFNFQESVIEVQHSKKRTNASFEGTLPVLDRKEAPHSVMLDGPCGIVSEDSSDFLLAVGSFGTKIAEDALPRYIQIQKAIAQGEDVSTDDMFFLLDSVRRSHRRRADEGDGADPSEVGEPSDPSQAWEDDELPAASRASSPGSDISGAEDGPSRSPDQPCSAGDSEPRRRLVLQPEELLFLSHALGCVRVTTGDGSELAGDRLYRHLSEVCGDRHLAARYAAYLELRGRGWVVRDGLSSGADFGERRHCTVAELWGYTDVELSISSPYIIELLSSRDVSHCAWREYFVSYTELFDISDPTFVSAVLYRRGPAFYHAALVVSVQVVDAQTRRLLPDRNWREADWLYTAGLCRVAEQTAKDVLLVRLLWPGDLEQPADLGYLQRVAVQHVLVRRWTPGRTGS